MDHAEKIRRLEAQGVSIPAPASVEIGDDVQLEQIHGPGTTIHAGSKLYGADLLVLAGTRIGLEEPVTLDNCAVGRQVQLNGGYFAKAVFLDRVVMGKGAHVRAGTLMEEESNGAHTVGLKQTVLLPFVTLGSLINFCDILMAGGTSRRDHSEVGSSFIHFNFTPFGKNGDKATPSLIGDVPRGVMLRSRRIFLGGQAGLVGPMHVDYGTVLAAGAVYRRDYGPDLLVVGEHLPPRTMPFNPRRYTRIRTKVQKNLRYIGNLVALWHWYQQVRLPLVQSDAQQLALYQRAQGAVKACLQERIKRLGQIASYMEDSLKELGTDGPAQEREHQQAFMQTWPELETRLKRYQEQPAAHSPAAQELHAALPAAQETGEGDYLATIQALSETGVAAGTAWLEGIVEQVATVPF